MTRSAQFKLSFQAIVSQHTELFPESGLDDLYKLVFQAAMGSEHAVTDPQWILNRLTEEADGIKPDTLPLMMPISPDHRLVRVGLWPYMAASGDLGELSRAFVETSRLFTPSIQRLDRYWSWVEDLAVHGKLSFSLPDLKAYIEQRRNQGYPAVHHCAKYRRLYHPAYRVVLKDLIRI